MRYVNRTLHRWRAELVSGYFDRSRRRWPVGVSALAARTDAPVYRAWCTALPVVPEQPEAPDRSAMPSRADSLADAHVELVEEIPTGHSSPRALEVTTLQSALLAADDEPAALPPLLPLALGAPLAMVAPAHTTGESPFLDPSEHLTALLDLTGERAVLAIALGWLTGELPSHAIDPALLAGELADLGGTAGSARPRDAGDSLAPLRRRIARQAECVAGWATASLAAGLGLPLVELSRELALSPLAVELLIAALAPRARPELARVYRTLGSTGHGDAALCDEGVLARVVAGGDSRRRDQVYAELAPGGALIRHGLVFRDPRDGLAVDDVVLARLRGQPVPRTPASVLRAADRTVDELVIEPGVLRQLVLELAAPREPREPLRLVIRGRRGSGRHTALAAFAERVDRRIACIDASQLPFGPARGEALRRELARAVIARAIPVVSGLELREGADPEAARRLAHVLRAHPGPIVVRTGEHTRVPIEPGHVEVVLEPLAEPDRRRAFTAACARYAIAASAEHLAARYAIGAGAITRGVVEACRKLDTGGDPTAVIEGVLHNQLAAQLAAVASRVAQRAHWDDLAGTPTLQLDEAIDHARFDHRLAAVFHGTRAARPGGDPSVAAAGVIARELGRALYRVELAGLRAAWVGELEDLIDHALAAAEDAHAVLLFDGIDELIARRAGAAGTTGPTDRGAHAARRAIDYLMRRLEQHRGVALIATRHSAIDPALQRPHVARIAL